MKKILFSLAAIAMMAISTVSLTSCGDDDDNTNDPAKEVEAATIKKVTYIMTCEPTEDMLKYANLKVNFTYENGKTVYTDINKDTTKCKIEFTEFPVNGTLTYTCTPKEDVVPNDSDAVEVNRTITIKAYYTLSDGTEEFAKTVTPITGNTSMLGSKLHDWLIHAATLKQTTVTIDENGNIK